MNIIDLKIESYAAAFASPQSEILQQIEKETLANHSHSQMLSGHVQGLFLSMMSQMIKPMNVLEIGSFTGFSAICLASGLQKGGQVHTIELREKDAQISEDNFIKAGLEKQIQLHRGNALDIISLLQENREWDLVFIDADKVSYIEYYELTLPKLKKGGFILADNVLFHGQVVAQPIKGKNAIAIDAFNHHVANDKKVEQVIVTLRDGLMLIRKL